jgi:hypothetical protein
MRENLAQMQMPRGLRRVWRRLVPGREPKGFQTERSRRRRGVHRYTLERFGILQLETVGTSRATVAAEGSRRREDETR